VAAAAAPTDNTSANPRFENLDANRDGLVSRSEFLGSIRDKKHWWQRGANTARTDQNHATPEVFEALDRDRDGYLTPRELADGRKLLESRGDNGPGASTTRNKTLPGDPNRSQKADSQVTPADRGDRTDK